MRRTFLAAALAPCAFALASCSASASPGSAAPVNARSTSSAAGSAVPAADGGNAGLSESQLEARITAAAANVTAIHLSGTMTDSGQSVSLDMQINKDGSAQGTVTEQGATIPVIATATATYLRRPTRS